MKRIIPLLLACALCLSLVLAGCGSKPNTGDDEKVIVLTMWHVYGSQTESPLNDVIDEFNATAEKEAGVFINVTSVTDSSDIDTMLTATLEGQPGAMTLPDLFTAYPRVAELFPEDALLDWNDYLTEEQLSAYRGDFLSEGYFGEALYMLPIAKSSELLFVDKTLFDRFAADTGVTLDCFDDMESLLAACDAYYDWSKGGTMFQINDFYHYFLANMTGLGEEFVVDGKINADSAAFEAAFAPVAQAGIYGGLCVGDGYASDRWKTGEVICNIGSTAGILYLRDHVTYDDNTTEDIETLVLPYPCLTGVEPTVVQRGGGLFAMKSDNEDMNRAKAVFAAWIAEKEHNLDFVTRSGYLPVTDAAFETLFNELDRVENEKYRMLYSAVSEQYDGGYSFCTVPLFDGASDTQKSFETLMKSTLGAAHEEFVARVAAGEAGEAVMAELTAGALSAVRAAVQ